jgi:hypothetical protein
VIPWWVAIVTLAFGFAIGMACMAHVANYVASMPRKPPPDEPPMPPRANYSDIH